MIVVAVTGGMGAGKSEAARLLAARGAVVLDADVIAKALLEPGTDVARAVSSAFGPEVMDDAGRIDHARLARSAFADPARAALLDRIVHPAVSEEIARRVAAYRALDETAPEMVVIDVPLLVEAPAVRALAQAVVTVVAPLEARLARLAARGIDEVEARSRIALQASDEARAAVSDVVVDNSGTVEELDRALESVWARFAGR